MVVIQYTCKVYTGIRYPYLIQWTIFEQLKVYLHKKGNTHFVYCKSGKSGFNGEWAHEWFTGILFAKMSGPKSGHVPQHLYTPGYCKSPPPHRIYIGLQACINTRTGSWVVHYILWGLLYFILLYCHLIKYMFLWTNDMNVFLVYIR